MGTRADFYIGNDEKAEWLGSVCWDGYEWENTKSFLRQAKTKAQFKKAIAKIAKGREDFTQPDQGWPWPWDDSNTTDYAYCFTPTGVMVFCFGEAKSRGAKAKFPNMKSKQKVTLGKRSGLIVLTA